VEAVEDGQRVAHHRGGDRRVGGPDVAEQVPGDAGEQPLEPVTKERRQRAARPELVERVPRTGVPVADGQQVDAVPPRDEQGDRDRAEQVPDHAGDHDVHVGLAFHP